jgi:hypothetical protein
VGEWQARAGGGAGMVDVCSCNCAPPRPIWHNFLWGLGWDPSLHSDQSIIGGGDNSTTVRRDRHMLDACHDPTTFVSVSGASGPHIVHDANKLWNKITTAGTPKNTAF